ncbi:MAG: NAD(P)/FAD-dependent oxidoreductase [Myxococcota bacterium]
MLYDLITIGGGAAGFFGAIAFAEHGGGVTLIAERAAKPLGKVKISGGGRCNVTHACFDPRAFTKHYPRGEKALLGRLHRFGPEDTVAWFAERGVELWTQEDGRMFPTTDDAQTVIDCLQTAASEAGVEVRTRCGIRSIEPGDVFALETEAGERLEARKVLIATGGTRVAAAARLAEQLGHRLDPPVPSLFGVKVGDPRLRGLPGIAVVETEVRAQGLKLVSEGPTLITHDGLSGPAILKLSAWGARELAATGYRFTLQVNWLPKVDVEAVFRSQRERAGRQRMETRSPFPEIPKRFWSRLLAAAGIAPEQTWADLTKAKRQQLVGELVRGEYPVAGKNLNKDEFVTCGGVRLEEIDPKTMESCVCPGAYFAGEVTDVDGITGGFNFQNAWTGGHLAGVAAAAAR